MAPTLFDSYPNPMHLDETLGDLFTATAATASATAAGKPQPQVASVSAVVSPNTKQEQNGSPANRASNNDMVKEQPESGTTELDDFTEFLERQTATVTGVNNNVNNQTNPVNPVASAVNNLNKFNANNGVTKTESNLNQPNGSSHRPNQPNNSSNNNNYLGYSLQNQLPQAMLNSGTANCFQPFLRQVSLSGSMNVNPWDEQDLPYVDNQTKPLPLLDFTPEDLAGQLSKRKRNSFFAHYFNPTTAAATSTTFDDSYNSYNYFNPIKRHKATTTASPHLGTVPTFNGFQPFPSNPLRESLLKTLQEPATPDFMVEELNKTKGTGEFTLAELAIMLFFAHKHFSENEPNPYSRVCKDMNTSRSRVSIRRKIEKIAFQELNITGGLLLKSTTRQKCVEIIRKRFFSVLKQLELSNRDEEKVFANKLGQRAFEAGIHPDNK